VDDPNAAIKKFIIGASLLVGFGAYAAAILWAGIASLGSATEPILPDPLTPLITGVGAALATSFGAFVGFKPKLGSEAFAMPSFKVPSLQAAAAFVYFVSLLAALLFWLLDGFSPTTAEIIRNQTLTLGGVVLGAVIVSLNTN
jgi:hypothetical protein